MSQSSRQFARPVRGEQSVHEQVLPLREPPRIEQRRARSVDPSNHSCPNRECDYYGWVGLGNIRANEHPNGGCWRQLECVVCHQTFLETVNTFFHRKQVKAEVIWQVLTALAEGDGIRKTARIFKSVSKEACSTNRVHCVCCLSLALW